MEAHPLVLVRSMQPCSFTRAHPIQAHSHARNASLETQKANPVAASEEHDLAAGEFANAAKSTSDLEARLIESVKLDMLISHRL
jgi:hypothetical protein